MTSVRSDNPHDVEALIGLCEATMRSMGKVRGTPEMEALVAKLSLAQGRCIWGIALHPHSTLGELSDHMGISASTASAQVEELVQLGLVERVTDEHDRRAVRITLSAEGNALFERQRERNRAHFDKRLQRLTTTERGQMLKALRLLSTLLGKMDDSSAGEGRRDEDATDTET